jgi:lipoate-protein ligase A
MKNGHEKQPERRKQRPFYGWHLWKMVWDEQLRLITAKIARVDPKYGATHPGRHGTGAAQRMRRKARLRAQAALLHLLRKEVRRVAREAAVKARAAQAVAQRASRVESHGAPAEGR